VEFTNLSNNKILFFSLVKKGYGSLVEVMELDTPIIMDILEYENIMADIESLAMDDARED